jgi:hypothetical protein
LACLLVRHPGGLVGGIAANVVLLAEQKITPNHLAAKPPCAFFGCRTSQQAN